MDGWMDVCMSLCVCVCAYAMYRNAIHYVMSVCMFRWMCSHLDNEGLQGLPQQATRTETEHYMRHGVSWTRPRGYLDQC